MHYLKEQYELFGLTAPYFSWIVAAGLILYSLYVLVSHWRRARSQAGELTRVNKAVKSIFADNPPEARQGLTLPLYDALRERFGHVPVLVQLWHRIEPHIIRKPRQEAGDEFWLAEPIDTLVGEFEVVDTHGLKIAPGIITGIGLLATFMAILIALLNVSLVGNRVQGLDLLIQGLSGKFLSSVVALSCAVTLLLLERKAVSSVHAAFHAFLFTLKENIPRLTPAQILTDMREDMTEQSTAFRIFNADLALKLKQSFGESVGPTLERMVQAVDDLNQFLKAAEAKKQESMTDQLAGLLRSLEESIHGSLEKMGEQFSTSLTGNTQGQFEKVTVSLGETAALLKEMNVQFTTNQAVLNDLINLAKSTTANQMNQGQAQVQELTGVLRELMVQLQEKTGESITSVQQALGAVTVDISNKVADLSVQMAAIIEETSGKSTQTAKEIMDKAGTLNLKSAENLERLLEKHGAEITKVEDLNFLFDSAIKGFKDSMGMYQQTTRDLKTLVAEVGVTMTSISQISNSVKEVQSTSAKVAQYATNQIDSLKGMNQAQKETWDKVQGSMTRYEQTFGVVEKQAKGLLTDIGHYLQDYRGVTENHFKELTVLANDHIETAVKRIGGSIDDLKDQLDELQTIVAGITRATKTVSH